MYRRELLRAAAGMLVFSAIPVSADGLQSLHIGYQKGGGLLGVPKARAALEEVFLSGGCHIGWSEFPAGIASEAIVVKRTSALVRAADLKGKSVAVQKGSSAHFLLLAALGAAGLAFSDIQPVYVAPAYARAAFDTNRVDAWAIWDPYLATRTLANRASQELLIILDELVIASQQRVADTFLAQHLIPRKVDIAAAVWQRPTSTK